MWYMLGVDNWTSLVFTKPQVCVSLKVFSLYNHPQYSSPHSLLLVQFFFFRTRLVWIWLTMRPVNKIAIGVKQLSHHESRKGKTPPQNSFFAKTLLTIWAESEEEESGGNCRTSAIKQVMRGSSQKQCWGILKYTVYEKKTLFNFWCPRHRISSSLMPHTTAKEEKKNSHQMLRALPRFLGFEKPPLVAGN